ncbi:MAG: tetratricopeptide repeat protein [Gammaproteobacteria bacterium]|nr:tetratricopeptide repeat protein [Gammaproteobacteria bacterium]
MRFRFYLSLLFLATSPGQAGGLSDTWDTLWWNNDQRGMTYLQQEKYTEAATTFDQPGWQGVAHFRDGDYEQAAAKFAQSLSPEALYNQGNALARSGKLKEALAAYEKRLEMSDDEDTRFNRDLVKKLLESQESQHNNQKNKDDNNQSGTNEKSSDSDSSSSEENTEKSAEPKKTGAHGREDSTEQSAGSEHPSQKAEQSPEETGEDGGREMEEDQADYQQGQSQYAQSETPMLEGEQSRQQWLNRIPDDPSGLLYRKLRMMHRNAYPETGDSENPW